LETGPARDITRASFSGLQPSRDGAQKVAAVVDPTTFRDVVSGRKQGLSAVLARAALRIAETPYTWEVHRRNRRFDRGLGVEHVQVPVVSVGNLTLGGTGKTPLVEWLCRWLRARQVRAAIVSRGYGARHGGRNDEAMELEERLPEVPHLQDADRVAAAQTAVEELSAQLIVLDDGFQHRRLGRDLDIVLLDALEPFGYGHVFPRGLLREPASGLGRAHAVVLSRADAVAAERREEIRETVRYHAPGAAWAEAAHRPQALLSSDGDARPIESLQGRRVAAFCGIGNPAGFRHTLAGLGCELVELREFPDHHAYTRADVESLITWAGGLNSDAVLTTHKDLVKIRLPQLGRSELRAVTVGVQFLSGEAELTARLEPLAARAVAT
jgi:tetraacyldisaccharide 4'-kinase